MLLLLPGSTTTLSPILTPNVSSVTSSGLLDAVVLGRVLELGAGLLLWTRGELISGLGWDEGCDPLESCREGGWGLASTLEACKVFAVDVSE